MDRLACRTGRNTWSRDLPGQRRWRRAGDNAPYLWALLRYAALVLLLGLCGCATSHPESRRARRDFDFSKDTLAYANGLVWVYEYDEAGHWTTHARKPRPDYAQRCFVMARSARQFLLNARFAPAGPKAGEEAYRTLVRRVAGTNPRTQLPDGEKVVIPGFADLRSFSAAHESLLKQECGGWSDCYLQRGNWRMVHPFTRRGQERCSEELSNEVRERSYPIVHLVRFPHITINHAVLVFGVRGFKDRIEFLFYDPNEPARPGVLTFERQTRTFTLPPSFYFPGGRVDVYEVFKNWKY